MTLEALSAINAVPIVQSDTTIINPPLKAIVLSAPGSLVFKNEHDVTCTFVVPAAVTDETVTALPFLLPGRIRQVLAATTIADADMLGLR